LPSGNAGLDFWADGGEAAMHFVKKTTKPAMRLLIHLHLKG
jgi:hypothetical protein